MTVYAPTKPVSRTLQTERLTLRQGRQSDLPAITAFYASDRTRFLRGPYDADWAFEKFATMIGHWVLRGFGRYVIEYRGKPVGDVGPMGCTSEIPPSFSWYLWSDAAEGQGFAFEAARAVLDHLIGDCGLARVNCYVQPENSASSRLAVRLGAMLTDEPSPYWYPGAQVYAVTQAALERCS